MDLSRIVIEPRVRNGWQALDLGFAMARHWFRPLYLLWALPPFCLLLVLSLMLFNYSWLAIVIVWWLKPLWDRLPLAWASRAVFDDAPPLGQSFKQSWRNYKTDWLAAITWRRFSPSRSFDLPVTVLEGLRGSQRTQRLTVLHQTMGNAATWLTLVCVHLENFFILGLWGLVVLMVPEEFQVNWWEIIVEGEAGYAQLSMLLSFLAMSLMGPFYTLAGFALYISRRIELEGWDIEIRFRHLAERESQKKPAKTRPGTGRSNAAMVLLLVGMGFASIFSSPDLRAQDAEEESGNPEPALIADYYRQLDENPEARRAKDEVVEVLRGDDFNNVETEKGWRFREFEREPREFEEPDSGWLASFYNFLSSLFGAFAWLVEIGIWVLLALLVAFLVIRYREGIAALFGRIGTGKQEQETPDILFGLDVRKESLPEDVPGQVLSLWRNGSHREAVSLLYRATFSRLIHQFSFEFYDGSTEQECVTIVAASRRDALSDYVARLTRVWQMLAYAHQVPDGERVQSLCREWPVVFPGESPGQESSHERGGRP